MQAITAFHAEYGYLPVSAATAAHTNQDFTFGTFGTGSRCLLTNGIGKEANNSEVIRILQAREAIAGTNGSGTTNQLRNPRKIEFFSAKFTDGTNLPGIGPDCVFRDPWGNPYIITLDLNGDGKCEDAVYRRERVSRNYQRRAPASLIDALPADGGGDTYAVKGFAMVWSLGKDGLAGHTESAESGVNVDNVLSFPSRAPK